MYKQMQQKSVVKNSSIIAILSAVLLIVLTIGITFAWFAGRDVADEVLTMGDAVNIHIVDSDNKPIPDEAPLPMEIPNKYLLPGMSVFMNAKVKFDDSNTEAVLRASLKVEVTGGNLKESEIKFLQDELTKSLKDKVPYSPQEKWVLYNNWFYFLGENKDLSSEGSKVENSICKPIDCNGGKVVSFINDSFQIPKTLDNRYANCSIKFIVNFQAIQAKLKGDNTMDNTILYVEQILNDLYNEPTA